MTVGIFFPKDNEEHRDVLSAFAIGMEAAGYTDIILAGVEDYRPVDLAVIFGVYKKAVSASFARGRIIAQQKIINKPCLVLEKGFVKRDEYYMVGFGDLNNRADFKNENMPSDRWNQLGVQIRPWKTTGEYILLCGQVPWDASCQHINLVEWLVLVSHEIRKHTLRPIRFRPHPLALNATPEIFGTVNSTRSLKEDFENAFAVVTLNSNTAVEAVIEGIPVFAFDRGSMAWPVANSKIDMISNPLKLKREQWAYNLAYAQWNLKEMEEGLAWNHLFRPTEIESRKEA